MQNTTELGVNRTGLQTAPEIANQMMESTELTRAPRGNEGALAKLRAEYAAEAEPVGSMPDPGLTGSKALLLDKLGERLAFERAGTRLYEALMVKCEAGDGAVPMKELKHIRDEEHMHFALVGAAIQSMGGDPTAQTPGADVTGMEGMGLMQVVTDPKTTVAQALHAILVAELTDNAAWEDLIELTTELGDQELVARFAKARDNEAEHLEKVRGWYKEATASRHR